MRSGNDASASVSACAASVASPLHAGVRLSRRDGGSTTKGSNGEYTEHCGEEACAKDAVPESAGRAVLVSQVAIEMKNGSLREVHGKAADQGEKSGKAWKPEGDERCGTAECEIGETDLELPVRTVGVPPEAGSVGSVEKDVAHERESAHKPDACACDDAERQERIAGQEVETDEDANGADGDLCEMKKACHERESRKSAND